MMCTRCLQSEVDVAEGVSRQITVTWCAQCDRYLRSATCTGWVKCDLESRELLAICLKKVKGLTSVKLIDASFLYTEPHSRRLKLKLTVQREVTIGTVLQQSIVVEAVVQTIQCADCKKTFTPHTWGSLVQLRQKVDHKRTMFHLEQLILKYGAHEKVTGVKTRPDGLDFMFESNSHSKSFKDFVQSSFPTVTKESKQLVSHDGKSNTYNYKFTIMAELCPVCKDDLVLLEPKLRKQHGGVSPLLVCTSVGASVHLIDPRTCRTVHVDGDEYWKQGFKSVCARKHLQQYVVLDIEPVVDAARRKVKPVASKRADKKKWQLCEVEIAREEDLGKEENPSVKVYCHLGNVLKAGDLCLGYDLRQVVVDGESSEALDTVQNDIMIVKKTWRRKEEFRNRAWKLKHLAKEVEEEEAGVDEEKLAREEEEYKRDIEEDEDLQKEVQLWKDPEYKPRAPAEDDDEEDEDLPEVALAQLLEDLTID
jgi:nonsense-mediated mRNA decay protein 3